MATFRIPDTLVVIDFHRIPPKLFSIRVIYPARTPCLKSSLVLGVCYHLILVQLVCNVIPVMKRNNCIVCCWVYGKVVHVCGGPPHWPLESDSLTGTSSPSYSLARHPRAYRISTHRPHVGSALTNCVNWHHRPSVCEAATAAACIWRDCHRGDGVLLVVIRAAILMHPSSAAVLLACSIYI